MLEVKAMSSNQLLAEKIRSARRVVGFLHRKADANSMDDDMLEYVWETLDDAVAQLVLPVIETIVLPAPGEIKDITIKPARDASVCPCPLFQSCDKCKKFEPRTTIWTAEKKAAHSAKLKAIHAAKKTIQTPPL